MRNELLNYSSEMLETVGVYFEDGANLRKISEVLYTHCNTIIYRINRLRDVFKIDLKDPETAITMQLAIRIRDLLL